MGCWCDVCNDCCCMGDWIIGVVVWGDKGICWFVLRVFGDVVVG